MKLIRQNHKLILFRQPSCVEGLLQKWHKRILQLSVGAVCTLMTTITAFAEDGDGTGGVGAGSDIWAWLDYALSDLYQKFLSVSTIAACVAASVCLILMNFSTDDRAVASSRAWLKRIIITWVILNGLGFIMAYVTPFFQGGQWTPSSP